METNANTANGQDAEHILVLDNITKMYGRFTAVDHVSLKVAKGEFLTLLGPSGSGKSTILMMIAGFQTPTHGHILLNGENILFKPSYKRNLGVAFQNYALFPHMTVFDNIAFPLRMRKMSRKDIKTNVERVLEQVQLTAFVRHYPKQLSGGQQQRVSLARALVYNPPILLLDEPLGALDKKLRENMQLEIKHLHEAIGITMIYVTHDQSEALTMSDRIVVLNHGRIEQLGSPTDLYERPCNRFVADFIGETNLIADLESREQPAGSFKLVSPSGLEVFVNQKPSANLDKLYVAIRPERITFLASPGERVNSYEAVVEEVIYLGGVMKYKVLTKTRDALCVSVTNELGTKQYRRGDRVLIGWHEEDVKVV